MNREIKFRAWEHGIMTQADKLSFREYGLLTDQLASVELMQYIGLKDKSGEIYESDIIKYVGDIEGMNGVFIVAWCPEKCGFYFKNIDKEREENHSHWNGIAYETARDYEVIGNIHENSELLTNK